MLVAIVFAFTLAPIRAFAEDQDLVVLDSASSTELFTDVNETIAHNEDILWLAETGISEGWRNGDGTAEFRPYANIARADMAAFIARIYRQNDHSTEGEGEFADVTDETAHAADIRWLAASGISTGWMHDDGTAEFRPYHSVARADMAAFIHRLDGIWRDGANISLEDFRANTFDVYINEDHLVTFSVNAISDADIDDSIYVYDEQGTRQCKMNDDGIDGDETADDNVYSGTATLRSDDVKLVNYHAALGATKSNKFEVSFYRDLTKEEFAAFAHLMNDVSSMSFEEVCDYVSNSPEVKTHNIDSDNNIVSFISTSGIGGIWDNSTKLQTENINNMLKGRGGYAINDAAGIDYAAAQALVEQASISAAHNKHDVVALRPFRSTEFRYDDFKTAANLEAKALNGNATIIDDGNVTVETMKNLSSYGTVLIDSHGTLKDRRNPYMLIGEELDEGRFLWDVGYYLRHIGYSADYLSGRIYCTGYRNRLAVGGKFFDRYYSANSLNDSFWYLGTCYSMHNNTISNALTKKGAGSVLGFSEPVTVGYCNKCLFEALTNSMILSADTVANGFNEAQRIYGRAESNGNEMRRSGNPSFKIVDSFDMASSGTLSGKVCRAGDGNAAIANAVIRISQNGSVIKSLVTDQEGNYSTRLPEGQYAIEVSANGYITFVAYNSVTNNEITYIETLLLVEESDEAEGIASGKITDALTGVGLSDVNLAVRSGWNNTASDIITTVSTNQEGDYSISLPLGNYTLYMTKSGYVANTVNIVVQAGETGSQNGTINPVGDVGTYRIVLTWGPEPSDLDSHMVGQLSGGANFWVYYRNKTQFDDEVKVCTLDVDDIDSFGPETITLNPTTDGAYYYYVHDFTESRGIGASGAQVRVYRGDDLVRTFYAPTNSEATNYWNVLAIKNGELIVRNTFTENPEIDYA